MTLSPQTQHATQKQDQFAKIQKLETKLHQMETFVKSKVAALESENNSLKT
jgi:hypothetical protein